MMAIAPLIAMSFLAATTGLAEEPSGSSSPSSLQPNSPTVSYFQDKTGAFGIADMLGGAVAFSPLEKGKTDFGFTDSVYWIRIELEPEAVDTRDYLELAYPLMDDIDFSLIREGKVVEHYQTGYGKPFAERPVRNRNFVFPLALAANYRHSIYLRLASSDRMEVPLRVWSQNRFIEYNNVQLLILGLYFGFVIIIAIYNFFMFVVLRFRAFIIYVVYILLFGFFMATQNGLVHEFLWPRTWGNHLVPQNLALFMLALTAFLWVFYENAWSPAGYRLAFGVSGGVLCGLLLASFLLAYGLAIQLAVAVVFAQASFLLYVQIRLLIVGNRTARYVIFAFSFLLVGGVTYWLKIIGAIASNVFSDYALQLGSGLEISFLSIAIGARFLQKNQDMNAQLLQTQDVTIMSLAYQSELRDMETGAHLARTTQYVSLLVQALRKNRDLAGYLSKKYEADIIRSAPLHDIGKVGIPDSILLKPGKLDVAEFEIMKMHCEYGARTLTMAREKLAFQTFLDLAIELIKAHHERWDGTGYPSGLKGDKIPLSARIMAIADVYDALTQKRVYKEAYSPEEAKGLIVEARGKHFDPKLVDAFLTIENQFRAIAESKPR